jgi:hypothetical protein
MTSNGSVSPHFVVHIRQAAMACSFGRWHMTPRNQEYPKRGGTRALPKAILTLGQSHEGGCANE